MARTSVGSEDSGIEGLYHRRRMVATVVTAPFRIRICVLRSYLDGLKNKSATCKARAEAFRSLRLHSTIMVKSSFTNR